VICTWPPRSAEAATVILSNDPQALVQRWAARRLRQVAPQVIAVTGSVGKTSTRHAIATLLTAQALTFQSRQSFNSLLGLPIALTRLRNEQRYAVLEFGSDRFGEIAHLAALFPPQIAVVTNVANAHLRAFGSLEGVAREQTTLVDALPPDGWAILNGDDPRVRAMGTQSRANRLTFGTGPGCDLRADVVSLSQQRTCLHLYWLEQRVAVTTPLLGMPAVYTALAAVGVALACNIPLEEAAHQLEQITPVEGRLCPLPARHGAVLLDDTFSASMSSLHAALETLKALPAQRRIIILGEINDLGQNQATAYEEIGAHAGSVADHLICRGDWGTQVVQAARRVDASLQTDIVHTATATLQTLPTDLQAGDLLLIKGSVEARMERITADLLAPHIPADRVLVRQEPGWQTVHIGAPDRPTWARIDLDAIAQNIQQLRTIAGVPVMVVLKADAYGHGAVRVGRTALANGATALAVATLGEARTLRQADITAPILVLGYTPPWQAYEAVWLGVICTVFDHDAAHAFADAARALERTAEVHIKVDTGMARLGLQLDQAGTFLQNLHTNVQPGQRYHGLHIAGLYTHFATADSADETFARRQFARFTGVLTEITAAGLRPPLVHAANSAALLRFPEARFDMVRPGIACYGLPPAAETPLPPDFRPALSFHSEVAQVKPLPPGTPLSYGGTFVTQRPSQIATIPVGYADGLRRSPPWREVLVRGQRAPIVGRICMDYALIDVTDIDGVKRGDVVVLIGTQGDNQISADEVAGWLGTINYEVVTTILPRVPREVEA
jgi:alanine racemase